MICAKNPLQSIYARVTVHRNTNGMTPIMAHSANIIQALPAAAPTGERTLGLALLLVLVLIITSITGAALAPAG